MLLVDANGRPMGRGAGGPAGVKVQTRGAVNAASDAGHGGAAGEGAGAAGAAGGAAAPVRDARSFFIKAAEAGDKLLKSGEVPFGDTHDYTVAQMVADLWSSLLTALGPGGAAASLLPDLSEADALQSLRLVAALMREAAEVVSKSAWAGGSQPGAPERQRARVLEIVADLGAEGMVPVHVAPLADLTAPIASRRVSVALLLWTTLARSLLSAFLTQPGAPPQIVAELVWLASEAQVLAANQIPGDERQAEQAERAADPSDEHDGSA